MDELGFALGKKRNVGDKQEVMVLSFAEAGCFRSEVLYRSGPLVQALTKKKLHGASLRTASRTSLMEA